jgi:predicted nucleotidyltransferase
MVESIRDLAAAALDDAEVRAILTDGDWYLVGSRATGFGDDVSDWDTIVLSRADPTPDQRHATRRSRLDEIFGIDEPMTKAANDLDALRATRDTHRVEINVYGPAGRTHRDGDGVGDVIWAYDLRHAVALHTAAGVGEPYRQQIAGAFDLRCPTLRDDAYLRFRMARNEVAATMLRSEPVAHALTTARCARHAARFWLLARGEPYPADKWLTAALAADSAATDLIPLIRRLTDASAGQASRFDAATALWQFIDIRATEVGVDPALLAGSPFTAPTN